ncbi:hypothetical protein D3C85_1615380 [compost metagenome]
MFKIQTAQAGIAGATYPVLDLCRHPHRTLRRHQVETAVGVYLQHAANGVGQLPPGMRMAVAQDDVGQRLEMAVERAWQPLQVLEHLRLGQGGLSVWRHCQGSGVSEVGAKTLSSAASQ